MCIDMRRAPWCSSLEEVVRRGTLGWNASGLLWCGLEDLVVLGQRLIELENGSDVATTAVWIP